MINWQAEYFAQDQTAIKCQNKFSFKYLFINCREKGQSVLWIKGPEALGLSSLLYQEHEKKVGLEVEHSEVEVAPIWDASITGGSFTSYATILPTCTACTCTRIIYYGENLHHIYDSMALMYLNVPTVTDWRIVSPLFPVIALLAFFFFIIPLPASPHLEYLLLNGFPKVLEAVLFTFSCFLSVIFQILFPQLLIVFFWLRCTTVEDVRCDLYLIEFLIYKMLLV